MPASKKSRKSSTPMPRRVRARDHQTAKQTAPASTLRHKIVEALTHDRFLTKAAAEEAAFHLVDWIDDLQSLRECFAHPRCDKEAAGNSLRRFLSHAPSHLAAAHRIVMGVPVEDTFLLGAVKGKGVAQRKPGDSYPQSRSSRKARSSKPKR